MLLKDGRTVSYQLGWFFKYSRFLTITRKIYYFENTLKKGSIES